MTSHWTDSIAYTLLAVAALAKGYVVNLPRGVDANTSPPPIVRPATSYYDPLRYDTNPPTQRDLLP